MTTYDACIKKMCHRPQVAQTITALDNYNFSEFLNDGRCLSNIKDAIEERYDWDFYQKYGFYMFDFLNDEELGYYLQSRYNIRTQAYIDWVVRCDILPTVKIQGDQSNGINA